MATTGVAIPSTPASGCEFEIDGLTHEGRGIAHLNGKAYFVDNALRGERVRATITKQRGRYGEAVATEILRAAPERAVPECEYYGRCGGCSLQHMTPAAQLALKQSTLLEQLKHIGGVEPQQVFEPITAPVWHYRRRARLGVRYVAKKNSVLVGFREKNSRFLTDMNSCAVVEQSVSDLLPALRAMLAGLQAREAIPQIEVAVGEGTEKNIALTLRHLQPLAEADIESLNRFATDHNVQILLQPGGLSTIHPPAGQQVPLHYTVAEDVQLQFTPSDFVQVNAAINRRAIARVLQFLELSPADEVLDLFCGLGNFTLPIARRAAHVVGLEGEAGLVQRARDNAACNQISNAQFEQVDLAGKDILAALPQRAFNKILIDPPRTGADGVLANLDLRRVEKLVYVSCNPATLARDARILTDAGLQLAGAGIMDMFPHTAHTEAIALFVNPSVGKTSSPLKGEDRGGGEIPP